MADQGDPRDEYERRFMSDGEGAVIHRDKHVARGLAGLLLVLAVLMIGLGVALLAGVDPSASPLVALGPLLGGLLVGMAGLTMGVVRTAVSETEVRVQLGLWGPCVPLESLRDCSVVEYQPSKFGGWGIRRALDGTWAYTTPDTKRVLSLEWEDRKGKVRRAVASVADPDAVVAAVRRAQQMAAAGRGARVVVERLAGADDPPDEEAEQGRADADAGEGGPAGERQLER